jgi:hypothetical protein
MIDDQEFDSRQHRTIYWEGVRVSVPWQTDAAI